MSKKEPYKITAELMRYIPPEVISVEPLEFDWDEATNAILFTVSYSRDSYAEWFEGIHRFLLDSLPLGALVSPEKQEDIFCASFWISLSGDDPMINPDYDLHVAWRKEADSCENLNAWIGSELYEEMVQKDHPQTSGIIRKRP